MTAPEPRRPHPAGHAHRHDPELDDAHDHGHRHDRAHPHDHGHDHAHPSGLKGFLHEILVPHSHAAADSIDDAMQASAEGIRAVKVSLAIMLATTAAQAVVVAVSGSVALLADTIHNLSDALTAVPLWIAFALARRAPNRRHPYGFGRAEDLAGLFIVLMIALSSIVAAWEAIDRILHPRPIEHLGWVIAAGVIGFLGNEAVAAHRIRVGRRIGSAALVADGVHARTDGFTSLAVVLGGVGALLGFPLADPLVGLLISAVIAVLLDRAEHALEHVPAVTSVERVRLRWVGHRLHGDALVAASPMSLAEADRLAAEAEASLRRHLPNLDDMTVRVTASASARARP